MACSPCYFQVAQCLESRIEKIKDIYSSGVLDMKGLAVALQGKAISDLEQMNWTIFSQITTVENVCPTEEIMITLNA